MVEGEELNARVDRLGCYLGIAETAWNMSEGVSCRYMRKT